MKHLTSNYFTERHEQVNQWEYNNLPTSSYDNLITLQEDPNYALNNVSEFLKTKGHCILQLDSKKNYDIEIITDLLTSYFGPPISFRNRKQLSYARVQSEIDTQHYVTSSWAQPMHTDEGHTRTYPQTIALYCAQPAEEGGISLLVEFQPLYAAMKKKFGDAVLALFDGNCLSVSNVHGQESKPLLIKNQTGKIGISYSPILTSLSCSDTVFEQYDFITNYVHNPDNQIRYKLQKNQILILDNTQALHSRTSFKSDSDRLLYRYWFTHCEL